MNRRRRVTASKSKVKALACPVPRPKMRSVDRALLERAWLLLGALRDRYSPNLDFPERSIASVLADISAELNKKP